MDHLVVVVASLLTLVVVVVSPSPPPLLSVLPSVGRAAQRPLQFGGHHAAWYVCPRSQPSSRARPRRLHLAHPPTRASRHAQIALRLLLRACACLPSAWNSLTPSLRASEGLVYQTRIARGSLWNQSFHIHALDVLTPCALAHAHYTTSTTCTACTHT